MNQGAGAPQVWPAAPAWFRFAVGQGAHIGAVVPPAAAGAAARWYDLGPLAVKTLLGSGGLMRAALAERIHRAPEMPPPARFLTPVPRGGKILCLAKNFAAHAREFGAAAPAEPIFFAKLPDALAAHGDPVVIPRWLDSRVDHEAELALVLGFDDPEQRGRKYVDAAAAPALVAGFVPLDDITARRLQGQDRDQKHPWLRSKSFDSFCPVGPWVVPADALDASDLEITMRVNGAVRQRARTSAMVFPIGAALAAISRCTTLRPGDLIAMGTPEGVGPIAPGDLLEVEISGIGVLRNPVVKES